MTIINNVRKLLITGDWPPPVGSTWDANARPEVAAIFSPAKLTLEKAIVTTSPELTPIIISCNIMGISLALRRTLRSGKDATSKIQQPRQKENTMRICSGTILEPKNGAAIRKAPTLNEAIKIRIKNKVKS